MSSKPTPPSPPKKKNTRAHPRFELFASVELRTDELTLVLPAKNISLGGIFLAADGNDLGALPVGDEVEVMVFDALDEGETAVRASAKIVRCDAEGVALTWSSTDPVVARRLANLLERLTPV
jgi:hypothetical protein